MTEHKTLHALIVEKASSDAAFRERLKTDPRAAVREAFDGRELPANANVKVVEQSPDDLYIVLPMPPTDGRLNEEQLEAVAGGWCICLARAPQQAQLS